MLNKVIENLAKRAGVDINDESFKAILDKTKEVEINDDIAVKLESNLFDIETAKQNYNLKSHFTALALNGVDAELNTLMDEFLSDNEDVRTELLGIKSTPKRVSTLAKKIKELTEKKVSADDNGDKNKANKAQAEIDRLINEFKEKEAKYQSDIEKGKNEHLAEIEKLQNKFFLQGLNYDKSKTMDENLLLADYHINNELQSKGAKRIYNQTTGRFELKRADDISLNWLDERNSTPTYEEFSTGVLTQKKLLAVADSSAVITPQPQQLSQTDSSGSKIDTSEFNRVVDEAISYQN